MSRRGSESTWQQKLSTLVNYLQLAQKLVVKKIQKHVGLRNQHLIETSLGLLFEIRINKVQHD